MSVESVREYLKPYGLDGRVTEFKVSSATVALAAEALGCEPGRIAKTLSFLRFGEPMLIVMAGDARVDNPKFKERFSCKAKFLTPEEALALTGHPIGGVCPFALPEGVPVYLDESLQKYDVVYPAAGSDRSAVKLTVDELVLASRSAGWVDVAKETP